MNTIQDITNKQRYDSNSFYTDYVNIEQNEITDIPKDISISTMCTSCKLNTPILNDNIKKYLDLDKDDILAIDNGDESLKTLIMLKHSNKKNKKNLPEKKKKRKLFFNQITIIIRINQGETDDINKEPKINVKLFKNGSIQMSGCKSIKSVNIVLNKLIHRLSEKKTIIEDNNIIDIKYLENNNPCIENFKIDMINTNYKKENMMIDRLELHNTLLKLMIKSSYEPCIRACVIVKHAPENNNPLKKEISIFIFEKGNIIITGARSKEHIISSYNYINKILSDNEKQITKNVDIDRIKIIFEIYEEIMVEYNNGLITI